LENQASSSHFQEICGEWFAGTWFRDLLNAMSSRNAYRHCIDKGAQANLRNPRRSATPERLQTESTRPIRPG
jgi:hypothetical protein